MLGIDSRAARVAWTVAVIALLLGLVYLVRKTLFVFTLAVLLAYLLAPLVNLLDRFLPTRTRTAALAMAYVIFLGIVVLVGTQIGSRAVEQAKSLGRQLPADVEKWKTTTPVTTFDKYKVQVIDKIQSEISTEASGVISALPQAGAKFLSVASDLIYIVIIPILSFFFLKDGRTVGRAVLDLMEEGPRRVLLSDLMADLDTLLAHYMRALVLLSLAAFVAYSIFFSIIGVPYGILLAAVGGALEFIPMLGPATSAAIIVLVAAISGAHVWAVIVFLLIFRVFQDYILSPHLMGQGVELHPLVVLFGVFAGAELAGIAGTFLSVPVLALVRVAYLRVQKARISAGVAPAAPVAVTSP